MLVAGEAPDEELAGGATRPVAAARKAETKGVKAWGKREPAEAVSLHRPTGHNSSASISRAQFGGKQKLTHSCRGLAASPETGA